MMVIKIIIITLLVFLIVVWFGFQNKGLDSDGSDIGEINNNANINVGDRGFLEQLMGWIDDSSDICEGSSSKIFKWVRE